MSRERLLPDEKTLEKVARYEAHLSRLFHKALHTNSKPCKPGALAAPLPWHAWTLTGCRKTRSVERMPLPCKGLG